MRQLIHGDVKQAEGMVMDGLNPEDTAQYPPRDDDGSYRVWDGLPYGVHPIENSSVVA